MTAVTTDQLQALYQAVRDFYAASGDLPFHGWHHIEFVYRKSPVFAEDLGADKNLTQAAALVHDLNYLVGRAEFAAAVGEDLRTMVLAKVGFADAVIERINHIVITADGMTRGSDLSLEAKALSDADTLFKALPVTPIIFASRFITQTNYSIGKLADKILTEQQPLFDQDIYFYSAKAKELYSSWGKTNLQLWANVKEALNDPDVVQLLQQAGYES